MLVLTRKEGETLLIGDDIEIVTMKTRGNAVQYGIKAPKDMQILRSEIKDRPPVKVGRPAANAK